MNDEDDVLYYGDSSEPVASSTDAIEIDYQKLEDSYYNALKRIDQEKMLIENTRTSDPDSDLVEFSSETDARFYTVGAAPTTCAQQQTAYLLDIRNVLLIFLLGYFCLSVYSKLKTTLINYTK